MLPSRRVLTLAGLAIVQVVNALRLPSIPRAGTVHCCALPPALTGAENFCRGALAQTGNSNHPNGWWRQDRELLQILLPLGDDVSFKRDVSIDLTRRRLELRVAGNDVLVGDLSHDVDTNDSEWFVEDGADLDVPDAGERCLVVSLRKKESFLDWASPLKATDADAEAVGGSSRRRVLIGGKGEAQKQATAQQLASYQLLQQRC